MLQMSAITPNSMPASADDRGPARRQDRPVQAGYRATHLAPTIRRLLSRAIFEGVIRDNPAA
jgi:hypothetical protein